MKLRCLVTWFCYHLMAKPGNKTGAPSWPDQYTHTWKILIGRQIYQKVVYYAGKMVFMLEWGLVFSTGQCRVCWSLRVTSRTCRNCLRMPCSWNNRSPMSRIAGQCNTQPIKCCEFFLENAFENVFKSLPVQSWGRCVNSLPSRRF